MKAPPPEFQVMVVNGQLESPIATVESQLEVGDNTVKESHDKPQKPLNLVSFSYNATVQQSISVKEFYILHSFWCNLKIKIAHILTWMNQFQTP